MATQMNTIDYLAGDANQQLAESSLPAVGRGILERNLLRRADPYLCYEKFGTTHYLGERKGQTMVFRRFEKLALATTPITDGVTPTGVPITKSDYAATILEYGNYTVITDKTKLTHVNRITVEASTLMGENMGETMDSVYGGPLVAGTSAIYVVADDETSADISGTASTGVNGTICKTALDAAIRTLRGNKAKPFMPMVPGSVKIQSYPIGKSYWCIIHPDQEHDFTKANGGLAWGTEYVPVEQYAAHGTAMENELGKYRNIRFIYSTQCKISADAGATDTGKFKSTASSLNDVYKNIIVGRDAYACVKLSKGSAGILTTKPGGSGDYLHQRGSVGWKAFGVSAITNDAWITRIECATLD